MGASRAGTVLLEAIAAMTAFGISAVAIANLVFEGMRALDRARRTEEELAAASAFLDAVAVWPREDLDRRLGEREQGPWRMYIERTQPTLFEIVLKDSTGGRVLLSTSVFRPERPNDVP
jgi:hypothetical protein